MSVAATTPDLLSIGDLRRMSGASEETIRAAISAGMIRAIWSRAGGMPRLLLDTVSATAWAERYRAAAEAPPAAAAPPPAAAEPAVPAAAPPAEPPPPPAASRRQRRAAPPPPVTLSIAEAAARLGVKSGIIYKLLRHGVLKAVSGPNPWRITEASVWKRIEWMKDRPHRAPKPPVVIDGRGRELWSLDKCSDHGKIGLPRLGTAISSGHLRLVPGFIQPSRLYADEFLEWLTDARLPRPRKPPPPPRQWPSEYVMVGPDEGVMTLAEAADFLGITRTAAERLMHRGVLHTSGLKPRRITEASVLMRYEARSQSRKARSRKSAGGVQRDE